MANLGKKGNVFVARFRFQGKEYKRSLHTTDRADAQDDLRSVERMLHKLRKGEIQIPEGVDAADFIMSNGSVLPASVQFL